MTRRIIDFSLDNRFLIIVLWLLAVVIGFDSLRKLPIDSLKIDRSFVRRIDQDPDDAAFAGAIVGMAKVLRLRVVVEGVETEAQRRFLEGLGCDEFQGFLHSTPVKAVEVAEMLQAQAASQVPAVDSGVDSEVDSAVQP